MDFDFIVIGAGISGAAAAHALAPLGRVLLIEAEAQPGYHSSGRSAALFTPNYGNATVRALIAAARPFFLAPPAGFAEPLLARRGGIAIAGPDGWAQFEAHVAPGAADGSIREITPDDAVAAVPILRREPIAFACREPDIFDIDVARLHQGFLSGLAARGGTVTCSAPVSGIERRAGRWHVATPAGEHAAATIVNAAGAWADQVARLASLPGIGLVPRRRSIIVVDAPATLQPRDWPAVDQVETGAYLKPETGCILASPGDGTPAEPGDAQPEEIDVALAADWLERATTLPIRQIARRWAGLRSFVADDVPVVGPDPAAEGFFWLAGQGGYGVMLAPILAAAVAGLIADGALPETFAAAGIDDAALGVERLRRPAAL
jgi:D-arginine dehydrogenase